jgi:acyl-[acyl-carrier-protein]-phospholipid O-acyltransferase/long-chain-fatty-acid--[acyl-carrier-protein] ligase
MKSVRLTITGAEKLPRSLADAFAERFGKPVYEGYGLTETSPVVSVNLPDPEPDNPGDLVQPSHRPGSVGKMAPGIAAEVRDPETGARLSLHEVGMLWLRGPNIFEGYLRDAERTAEVLQDGWLKTGDLGRFDEDGFLSSKAGSHGFPRLAGKWCRTKLWNKRSSPRSSSLARVTGRSLSRRSPIRRREGARLVEHARDRSGEAAPRLHEAGVPNLWIPKISCGSSKFRALATGKLDLRRCSEIAAMGGVNLVRSLAGSPRRERFVARAC